MHISEVQKQRELATLFDLTVKVQEAEDFDLLDVDNAKAQRDFCIIVFGEQTAMSKVKEAIRYVEKQKVGAK